MTMNDRKLGKVLKYSLAEDEGDEADYKLTFRQARALLQTLEYLKWMSRHLSLPSDLSDQKSLNDWVQDLEYRLLKEIPPLDGLCDALYDCADAIDDIVTQAINGTATGDIAQALRDALDTAVNNYVSNNITNIIGKGSPLNPTVTTDTDLKLFGQCVKIVEYTHDVWDDVLQQLEIVSNNVELIKHSLDSIPFLKFLTDAIPANSWLDDLDYILSIEQEGFEAGYTEDIPDGTKWIMSCAIYCACKADHTITVDRIYTAFTSLLSGYTVPSFENLDNWLSTLLGVDDNDPLIVYATYSMLWGVARLTSFFGNVRLSDGTLRLLLKIGEQDTSLDPNDYCLDCVEGMRWQLYPISSFSGQIFMFTTRDGEWDVWQGTTYSSGTAFASSNGTSYGYGINVSFDDGTSGYNTPFSIEDLTGNERSYALMANSTFEDLDHFHGTTGEAYVIAQMNTTTPNTVTFRVKPR